MTQTLLKIENLHVSVEGTEILHGVNLEIPAGEVHVLFGPNGSGKSTLMSAIMGLSHYEITNGRILFKGEDITYMPIEQRAKLGLGIAFQKAPIISGVTLRKLLTGPLGVDPKTVNELAAKLKMTGHLDRDINKGFSGGEIKRSEILQLSVQKPDLMLLDEPESGVDLENIELLAGQMAEILERTPGVHLHNLSRSALIITHTGYILNYLTADKGHVMLDGNILCAANPIDILRTIKEFGYQECIECIREAEGDATRLEELIRSKLATGGPNEQF